MERERSSAFEAGDKVPFKYDTLAQQGCKLRT